MPGSLKIQLVVFDWAGTLVDYGCLAQARAFLEAFAKSKLMLTTAQVRWSMGLHNYEHIHALLEMPPISEQFQMVHGRPWTDADVMNIYDDLAPLQFDSVRQYSHLTPHVLEVLAELRSRGLKVGTTSDYARSIAECVYEAARLQGIEADTNVAADDTPSARPAPWMMFRLMSELNVFPPATVVKIGDTIPDIEEGLNAGCWSIGITAGGSEVGMTLADWQSLTNVDRSYHIDRAARKLYGAGAHYVIPSLVDLPNVIDRINERMETGERP
ncbi:Phosphonoacetaldehyde hydrolase [Anatilimnocola aggregata]|uniref:Phosphonoacetaldehyde hydrolase n=1 Tax=Anatilimnocola aggregata TaxID=2528021 RepID=A0A517Y5I9_9BACT|nr:phosphonoacetaldehyde hydrolase [Anatilimnocola aggregata]QDU25507.1 Phosphonoacetaldehyde hydrolase [Anatilimnocola aggregata]